MDRIVIFSILLAGLGILQNVSVENVSYSEGMNSSETNSSCLSQNNNTNDTCEVVTTVATEILLSTEILDVYDNTSDADNSTMSPDNTTVADTTTEGKPTPTSPHIETTTESVSTTDESLAEARPVANEVCTCDMTMDSCDINCCCDTECSDKDRQAFSGCHMRAQYNYDPRHCYQTHFIYHNNTELKMVRSPEGLFCIVKDNLPARFLYKNRRVVKSLNEFNKLLKRRKTFHWATQVLESPVFDPSKQYRAGDVMWTVRNKPLVPFSLPASVTSSLCQTSKIMHYLQDWSGECGLVVPLGDSEACETNPALSAQSFYSGFSFLSAPRLINDSRTDQLNEGCSSNICIPITVFICPEFNSKAIEMEECSEVSDVQYPVFNSDARSCENVIRQLSYKIYHNGTDGITKVHLYIWLANLTVQRVFSQTFSVTFHWTKDEMQPFHRSGNPGYVVGKPVMSGSKITKIINIEEDVDKEAIKVSKNTKDWISIAVAMPTGECDLEQKNNSFFRQAVTFGEDRLSSCIVAVTPANFTSPLSCGATHKYLIQLLAGNMIENITSPKQFNLYIATFGDSKPEETGDWVQVILENVPLYVESTSLQKNNWTLTCKSMVTSIHLEVMFAHVGSLAFPQAKILGAVFRFGQPHDISYSCSSHHCVNDKEQQKIKIVSTVSFIDVSKPVITEFAEPPVYEIKLPHDFFYPFFNTAALVFPNCIIIILLLIFIIITQY